MTANDVGFLPSEQDSVGCLLVIAGYDDISAALRLVTEQAISHINVSPELGDFFEVRFVGLGRRQAPDEALDEVAARAAAALTRPTGSAERHYFALMLADRSAALVARMLDECGQHAVIGRLPIRYRGLASVEDRLPGQADPERPGLTGEASEIMAAGVDGIVVASAGAWRRAGLVYQVEQFARELLHDFASAAEAGLTGAQLGRLRLDAREDTTELRSPGPLIDELTPVPADQATQPGPSLLPMATANRELARRAAAPQASYPLPSPARRLLPGGRLDAWRVGRLWSPARLAAGGTPAGEHAPDAERQPRVPALVVLALVGDEGRHDLGSWRRGRSVLLEIDEKLAAADPGRYLVRALRRAGDAGMTEPLEPGRLTRHHIGRPALILNFPRVLNLIRSAVEQQRAPQATVVLFAAAAPLADAVTMATYRQLADETAINWIVPERVADLLSPRFKEGGARKIDDRAAVADEIVAHLSSGESHERDE